MGTARGLYPLQFLDHTYKGKLLGAPPQFSAKERGLIKVGASNILNSGTSLVSYKGSFRKLWLPATYNFFKAQHTHTAYITRSLLLLSYSFSLDFTSMGKIVDYSLLSSRIFSISLYIFSRTSFRFTDSQFCEIKQTFF